MPNPRDECPMKGCKKSIHADPSHFSGVPADAKTMLRCVLYEMFVLASSSAALQTNWKASLKYRHPKLGEFTPSESLKIATLISFRILHDFLYETKAGDDFSIKRFAANGAVPSVPKFIGFERGSMFTKESINKFMAHLTWARINKPKCVPQPKFKRGARATIINGKKVLSDAKHFVDVVCDPSNPNCIKLDRDGEGFRKIFEEAFAELLKVKT